MESSPKMSIYFPFEAFKQTETVFLKDEKVIGAKIVQHFTVQPLLSFVLSLMYFFVLSLIMCI